MRKATITALFILPLLLVSSIALAIPGPVEDLGGFLNGLLDAVAESNWRLTGAFVIIGLVALVRKYGPEVLKSGKAAFATSLAIGALIALASALEAGVALGGVFGVIKILVGGSVTGLVASGIYSGTKKTLEKKE